MWVVRDQLTSPDKINRVVETAVKYNFNFLIVQVVGRGDAYYQSDILPRSEALDGQRASFDPLQLVLDLAHPRGIKVIAWLNDMYLASFGSYPKSKQHIVHAHPEWITYTVDNISLKDFSNNMTNGPQIEGMFLDPGAPGVKEHIVARYTEIVRKYAVDGVHHDYIRYSNPNLGYHPEVRAAFQKVWGYDPIEMRTRAQEIKKEIGVKQYLEMQTAWDQWRRDQITAVVKAVYEGVKAVKPQVEVSAACVGFYKDAYSNKFQDWKLWLTEGYVDIAMPMIYEPQSVVVNYMTEQALGMQGKGKVIPGFGAYTQLDDVNLLIEKIQFAREKGSLGVLFFDYGSMIGTAGYLDALKRTVFAEPALYPQLLK